MKKTLLLVAFASIASFKAFSQEHHSDNYNLSVFYGYENLPASKRIDRAGLKAKVNQHFPQWYVYSDKLNGNFTNIFGNAIALNGNTLEDKVATCINNHLNTFGVNGQDWIKVQNTNAGFASFLNYKQVLNGHDVVFSKLSFRFTTDGRLQQIQMKNYGQAQNITPSFSKADAMIAMKKDLTHLNIAYSNVEENWVWFPVPSTNGYELRPAWNCTIIGKDEYLPVELYGYVDAITGDILYRNNDVKETDLTVNGRVYKQNPLLPSSIEPLSELRVEINNTPYFTDVLGFMSDASLSSPVNATVFLEGRWSRTRNLAANGITPSYILSLNGTGTVSTFDTVIPSNDRLVNAYYHVTRIHDFMKGYFPAFAGLDNPLTTNVDNGGGSCNAFYTGGNGGSINFYAASGTCNSFAYCGDIIYHEYGHAINHKFYQSQGATRMNNGALNEGYADIWALGLSEDPVLGKGSRNDGTIIRRYDLTPKVHPQDIVREVHGDGEIIAGAWWDVAQNIGSIDTMMQIFSKTFFATPDGPTGAEGDIYHDVLINALLTDDNDANLVNGTPHFIQIVDAFARHGIYLMQDAELTHTEIANQPANTPIPVTATLTLTEPAFFQDMKLFYKARTAANFDSITMTDLGSGNFTATLPAFSEGTILDYYFAVNDRYTYTNKYFPQGFYPNNIISAFKNNLPYQFGVGLQLKISENFENFNNTGWEVGAFDDNAGASGAWIVASPVGSSINSLQVQTNTDHTTNSPNGKCLITGNASSPTDAIGVADVDSGITSVVTPVFDLSGFIDPVLEYYRWYGNDRGNNKGNDYWKVYIRVAQVTGWSILVDNTVASDYSWRRRIFNVKDFSLYPQVQLRFEAADIMLANGTQGGQSTVEAAVDDIFIYDKVVTGVNDYAKAKAEIYPNPANTEIRVVLTDKLKGVITLNDIAGKELSRIEMNGSEKEYIISTNHLAEGVYMLMINSGKSIQTSKVSVVH